VTFTALHQQIAWLGRNRATSSLHLLVSRARSDLVVRRRYPQRRVNVADDQGRDAMDGYFKQLSMLRIIDEIRCSVR
jgi:hypothetical protein